MGGVAAGSGFVSTVAHAIEPIRRTAGPKFKFSLAAYSYRKFLTGDPPQLTVDDFIRDCAKMGLEGTELTSYYFPSQVTNDYLLHLKHLTFRLGLDISGSAIRNDFCLPPGQERDRNIAHVKRWVDYAEILGAPVIRVFSGKQHGDQSFAETQRLAVEAMEECCEYAGKHGVFLALENHGGLSATPEGLLALVREVDSPWFGVNLDSGNFYGSDVYADLAQLAPYALNVQIKASIRPNRGAKQPCNFNRVAQIMRDASYRGYIVLEYEDAEDPREACPRLIEELRSAFA